MKIQCVARIISISLALVGAAAQAADRPAPAGFYGGLALRDQGVQTGAFTLGIPSTALNRFTAPALDDATVPRATLYGGYRWANDVAVEAAINTSDAYALRPADPVLGRRGVGVLPSASSLGIADGLSKTWNLDLYTGWNFYRNMALYGRVGYSQTDAGPAFASALTAAGDPRRLRDGMNYGVGVRYNMTSAFGLRLEYGRFGRFAGEVGSSPLESDQVTIGLQFRF